MPSNLTARFFLLAAALLFPLHLLADDPPSVLWSRFDSRPLFIAASAVMNPDGSPSAIVPEGWGIDQTSLRSRVVPPSSQTPPFGVWDSVTLCQHGWLSVDDDPEEFVNRSNAHDAIISARVIVSGTIRRVTPGFFYTPASLVELDHLDKIKIGTSYSALHDVLYIRIPYARFAIGDHEYCRDLGPNAYAPRAGDKLLVFAYAPPLDAEGKLLYLSSDDVIVQPSAERELRIPKVLAIFGGTGSTIESITASIRAAMRVPSRR
ncbi:MAG: hypothetical protein QOK37_2232 [Thermoanaerobaculia bacterium]|jgi:hypothetical protein|nr:hypothetical protein [Thermoanaerobaculia bacterium]